MREREAISDQFMFGPALLINPVTTGRSDTANALSSSGQRLGGLLDGQTREGRAEHHRRCSARQNADLCQAAARLFLSVREWNRLSAKADPIELRIYAGANGDFTLYEDEGDNYDYEHGAHSVIPMHWDDKSGNTNHCGPRRELSGNARAQDFHIVIVRDGHGTGIASTSEPDATVEYDGKAASVRVQPKM